MDQEPAEAKRRRRRRRRREIAFQRGEFLSQTSMIERQRN